MSQLAPSQLASDCNTKEVSKQNAEASDLLGSADHTTFTSDSGSVSALVSKAMSSPEIRQNLVETLKHAVNSGQYELDPTAIASAMLDEHL